ncbi:hypothetical protein NDU88_006473, partial [Pleurodeles waltl]
QQGAPQENLFFLVSFVPHPWLHNTGDVLPSFSAGASQLVELIVRGWLSFIK